MKRSWLLLLLLVLFTGLAVNTGVARTQEMVRMIVEDVETDETPSVLDGDYPMLELSMTPVNASGVPIGDLSKADFTLREDGRPIDEFEFDAYIDPDKGISVMLVLDVSGSMKNDLEQLREAALALYDYLELTDESGLVAFSILEDGTTVDLSDPFPALNEGRESTFTHDEGMLRNLINALEITSGDGTPLYDALYKGTRMAATEANNARRAVILMTDGVDESRAGVTDEGSQIYDSNSVIDEIRLLNVPVFTIGLGDEIDVAFLQRVANATGGRYQNTPDAAELGQLFTDIASELKQMYRISYESQTISDDGLHNLEVSARTPLGDATSTVSFKARFPLTPWIRTVAGALPRQDARAMDAFDSVKGTVTITPDVVAREAIASVNYYVDGELAFTAVETPWTFEWNTRALSAGETHTLMIEALDDSEPPNSGSSDEMAIMVEECTLICVFESETGIPATYAMAAGGALLVLLIVVMMRRRPQGVEDAGEFAGPMTVGQDSMSPTETDMEFQPVPQPPPLPVAGPTIGLDVSGQQPRPVMGMHEANGPARVSPKTEVLRMKPELIAFLIDGSNGRQFRLADQTSLGRAATNDVVLDDPAVSSQHAKIRVEGQEFVLFDLAATNPTLVNGARITRHVLNNGDQVQLGRHNLIFKFVGDPSK